MNFQFCTHWHLHTFLPSTSENNPFGMHYVEISWFSQNAHYESLSDVLLFVYFSKFSSLKYEDLWSMSNVLKHKIFNKTSSTKCRIAILNIAWLHHALTLHRNSKASAIRLLEENVWDNSYLVRLYVLAGHAQYKIKQNTNKFEFNWCAHFLVRIVLVI